MGRRPLAAWATRPGFRIAVIIVTIVVGVFAPTANGDRFALFQIVDAARGQHHRGAPHRGDLRLPWRPLPNEELTSDAAGQDQLLTSQTRQAAPVPGVR